MSNMTDFPDTSKTDTSKTDAILTAAFAQFSQYGFQKTSMSDIARAMGISRASLYTYFDNKEEIFKKACVNINAQSLQKVERLLTGHGAASPIAERVNDALLARYGMFLEIAKSPHGSEIYNERNRLCGALAQESVRDLRLLLTKALKAAEKSGEINLKNINLSPAAAAEILQMSAAGLKVEAVDSKAYGARLQAFIRIFFAGIGARKIKKAIMAH